MIQVVRLFALALGLAVDLLGCADPYGEEGPAPPPAPSEITPPPPDTSSSPPPPPSPPTSPSPKASTNRCDPSKPFGAPTLARELNETSKGGFLSADELEIFYLRDDGAGAEGSATLRHGKRAGTSSPWVVQTKPALHPPAVDLVSVAAGGLKLYYYAKVNGSDRLHVATRTTRDGSFGQGIIAMENLFVPNVFVADSADVIYFSFGNAIYQSSLSRDGVVDMTNPILEGVNGVSLDGLRPVLSAQDTTVRFQNVVAHRTSRSNTFSDPQIEPSFHSDHRVTWTSQDDCVVYLVRPEDRHIYVAERGK